MFVAAPPASSLLSLPAPPASGASTLLLHATYATPSELYTNLYTNHWPSSLSTQTAWYGLLSQQSRTRVAVQAGAQRQIHSMHATLGRWLAGWLAPSRQWHARYG